VPHADAHSLFSGVIGGATALIAAPALGAREEGAVGFLKGLGAGEPRLPSLRLRPYASLPALQGWQAQSCCPSLVPQSAWCRLAGAWLATAQGLLRCTSDALALRRGIANTPEAVMSARDGKRWNNERRVWVVENLEDEAATLPVDDEDILSAARERARCNEGAGNNTAGGAGRPADMGFYEALGVSHTATQAEIKRAYYLLARQLVRTLPIIPIHIRCAQTDSSCNSTPTRTPTTRKPRPSSRPSARPTRC
jgi:hypothetical protein